VRAGILGVVPDEATVKCLERYANPITFPPVIALWIVIAARVPHEEFDVGNETMFAFVPVVGFVPLGAGKLVVVFE